MTRLNDTLEVLDLCRRTADALRRPDLAARLEGVERRLNEPIVNTLVVGEFKKGKSTLINGLVTAEICPADSALATAVPTVLSYGPEVIATAVYATHDESEDGADGHPNDVSIQLADIETLAVESDNGDTGLRGIEVQLPRQILKDALVLVDTPGVGGLMSRHGGATLAALSNAKAVVFVTDAGQELTAAEAEFLSRAHRVCPTLAVALTKIDIYPEWRQVLELNRRHLNALDISAPIIPLSSAIRYEAMADQSRELSIESGFPELVRWLRGVTADVEETSVRGAVAHMTDAVAQLTQSMSAERDILIDPDAGKELSAQLTEAEERARELQGQASRWHTALNDGIADLTANVEHDLRTRVREVTAEAQEQINNGDPSKMWEEFERWLHQRSTAAIVENYDLLRERAEALGQRVGDVFQAEDKTVVAQIDIEPSSAALEALEDRAEFDPDKGRVVESAFTALRGGQSGLLLFGVLGGVVGIAVEGPILIIAGLFMAGKSIRQERKRQVTARRQKAIASVRTYLDRISFLVAKESRDTLRAVQRVLRDHYQERAVERHTFTQQALQAVRAAVQTDERERRQRLSEVQKALKSLDALAGRVNAL